MDRRVVNLLLDDKGNFLDEQSKYSYMLMALSDIADVAQLPLGGGILLVAISMFLTFIAGLIPSRIAAKKDPVVALRTE